MLRYNKYFTSIYEITYEGFTLARPYIIKRLEARIAKYECEIITAEMNVTNTEIEIENVKDVECEEDFWMLTI